VRRYGPEIIGMQPCFRLGWPAIEHETVAGIDETPCAQATAIALRIQAAGSGQQIGDGPARRCRKQGFDGVRRRCVEPRHHQAHGRRATMGRQMQGDATFAGRQGAAEPGGKTIMAVAMAGAQEVGAEDGGHGFGDDAAIVQHLHVAGGEAGGVAHPAMHDAVLCQGLDVAFYQGKRFFFKKKKQKTFVFKAVPTCTTRLRQLATQEIKVFWFFFSKKNSFLSFFCEVLRFGRP
jgi:hypothetical protein